MINYCKVDLNLIITHFVYLSIRHSGFIYFYWFIGIILLIGLDIGGEDDRAEILNNALVYLFSLFINQALFIFIGLLELFCS